MNFSLCAALYNSRSKVAMVNHHSLITTCTATSPSDPEGKNWYCISDTFSLVQRGRARQRVQMKRSRFWCFALYVHWTKNGMSYRIIYIWHVHDIPHLDYFICQVVKMWWIILNFIHLGHFINSFKFFVYEMWYVMLNFIPLGHVMNPLKCFVHKMQCHVEFYWQKTFHTYFQIFCTGNVAMNFIY